MRPRKTGGVDKAIGLLKRLVTDNPEDWNSIDRLGDLYAKLNDVQAANEQYPKVADFYSRTGAHLKAIAVWKKLNKNDPTALEPYRKLGDLYAKQGLSVDAKAQYEWVFNESIRLGRIREAGDTLKRLAKIDPTDIKIRSRLADLYMREGNLAQAVEEHIVIAEELGRMGHLTEAVQVLEKGRNLDPTSARIRSAIARIHFIRN